MCMKTGKLVKDRKNHYVFSYNKEKYSYDKLYNLVKDLDYTKTGLDCDWTIIRATDLKSNEDVYVLAFQDSRSNEDWFYDFLFIPKFDKGMVWHRGFYKEYYSAREEIHSILKPLLEDLAKEQNKSVADLTFYITGFSLGGSIAPIAAKDCHDLYGLKPIMIAFEGANPCESFKTRNAVMNSIDLSNSIAFVYSNDFVPRCAPFFGRKLKDIIYYLNDHKCKFPFYLIKKVISFIKDSHWYHANCNKGILQFMPWEEQ